MTALPRRGFLTGLAGAGIGGAAGLAGGTIVANGAAANPPVGAATDPARSFPFHGAHQSGITTAQQRAAAFVSFDVTAGDRDELEQLLRTLTERIRFLTTGAAPTEIGIAGPPSDSGVLGPESTPDGLTITLGVGASLFDDRYGLGPKKPSLLRQMESFANDSLDRDRCDGDLLLQIRADNVDTVLHALRDLARATRGGMQPRWRQDGFVSPPRPSGTPRNLMGFKDGISNPDADDSAEMDSLVWTAEEEPEWARGGTYQVVRVIRMLVEFWDRVNLHEQESMIGRRRDTGAPLSRSGEFDDPDYVDDPSGSVIPMSAHIRLANPRTPDAQATRMLRRAYNYDAGTDPNGDLDMGLVFVSYQRDLEKQFVATQKRLADEPLTDYISPVGGGYFYVLPGVADRDDSFASGLLS